MSNAIFDILQSKLHKNWGQKLVEIFNEGQKNSIKYGICFGFYALNGICPGKHSYYGR